MPAAQDRRVIESLVELVRSNPVLYDTSMMEHRDAQLRQNIWTSIADAMGNPSVNGEGWKKKWTGLRDTYMKRKKKKPKSGQADSNKKPWVFFSVMTFLDDFIERKSTDGNLGPFSSQEDDESEEGFLKTLSDDERSSLVSNYSHRTKEEQKSGSPCSVTYSALIRQRPSHTPPCPHPKKRQRGAGPDADVAIQNLNSDSKRSRSVTENETADDDPDGDEAFFLSCSRRIRKFPAQARSFLKLQISQLFFNAENPTLPPLPITPLPPAPTAQPSTTTCTETGVHCQHASDTTTNVSDTSDTGDCND
ncbi:uncharacterized protein LOC143274803 [Babylonia areolata]|uniref:uncharacterized protein LOC143274803 n=1 Tax=Babylonia areolata TaxID=304850 RepID=UPI003FCF293D